MLVFSCHKAARVEEVKDKELTLQVSVLKDKAPGDESLTCKARIIPAKELAANETTEQKRLLNYKMDSCFYIKEGNNKNYASMVQAIANGVSGTYEYLLVFDPDQKVRTDSVDLIYQDRYINHKLYNLRISQK